MAEEVDPEEASKRCVRGLHSSESHRTQGTWNDIISRSGLDSEEIFTTIKKLLRCTVCLEYHEDSNQCKNGHLICRQCTRQLERGLQPEASRGTCPTCRVPLFPGISRCLLASQLSAELPTVCLFCGLYFRQSELEMHEINLCPMRPVKCKYNLFGCLWKGKASEEARHEKNCSVSKRSVKEVEAILQDKLGQRSKKSCDSSSSWNDLVSVFKERPSGMVVCIREVTLHRATRENRRNEVRFQGTSGIIPNFNVTVELTISLDEFKIFYRVRFHSGLTKASKFRLLSTRCDELTIPIADRFRTPKERSCNEWQKFHCQAGVCEGKLMTLSRKFSDLTTANPTLQVEFLVVSENRSEDRLSIADLEEWNVATTPSPASSQRNEEGPVQGDPLFRSSGENHHQEYEDDLASPSPISSNRGEAENRWDSNSDDLNIPTDVAEGYRVFIDEMTEGIVVAMNEASTRQSQRENTSRVLRLEELPPIRCMRNNNALESLEIRASTSREDTSHSPLRVLRSGAQIGRFTNTRRRVPNPPKKKNHLAKRLDRTFEKIAPYLTRGHMWQNFEVMKFGLNQNNTNKHLYNRRHRAARRAKAPARKKRTSVGQRSSRSLLTHLNDYWSKVKEAGTNLIVRGQQQLAMLQAPTRCAEREGESLLMNGVYNAARFGLATLEHEVAAISSGDGTLHSF